MHIDYKTIIWQRVYLPDNIKKKDVLRILKKDIGFSCEVYDALNRMCDDTLLNETLYNTDFPIDVKDNNGMRTVELVNNKNKTIWKNGR